MFLPFARIISSVLSLKLSSGQLESTLGLCQNQEMYHPKGKVCLSENEEKQREAGPTNGERLISTDTVCTPRAKCALNQQYSDYQPQELKSIQIEFSSFAIERLLIIVKKKKKGFVEKPTVKLYSEDCMSQVLYIFICIRNFKAIHGFYQSFFAPHQSIGTTPVPLSKTSKQIILAYSVLPSLSAGLSLSSQIALIGG